MPVDFTEAELRSFSKRMQSGYRHALLNGKATMAAAGILENGHRLSHFMGQFGGETSGGEITRESLTYTSVGAIRRAWKARASKHTDAWIKANLLRNPVALGDWAYGGRMGNRKGTSDGYDYRGGGMLQTTGRSAVQEYCEKCSIPIRPDILDDFEATLKFACVEWQESGCNDLADQNDIVGISKTINTGSAKSNIVPNGMDNRRLWFDKARDIWWDAVEAEAPVSPPDISAPIALWPADAKEAEDSDITFDWLVAQGCRAAKLYKTARNWFWKLLGFGGATGTLGIMSKATETDNGTIDAAGSIASDHAVLILGGLVVVLIVALALVICLGRRYLVSALQRSGYVPKAVA